MLRITCSPEFLGEILTTRTMQFTHISVKGLPDGCRLVSAMPKVIYENHWSTSVEWELLFSHPDSPDNVIEDVTMGLVVESADC
jgi:hypothetical protein